MQIVIIILAFLIVISILGSIFEDNGVRMFSRFFYQHGIKIYEKVITVSHFNILSDEKYVITKEEGVFNFSDDGVLYFHSNESRFRWFRIRTPFAFKAMGLVKEGNVIEITARLPLSFSILSITWTLLGIAISTVWVMPGLIFAFFPLIIFLTSYPVERLRMETMVTELEEIIGTHSQIIR